ncbi:hypothetical protein JVX92_01160 [Microbacterium hominis]|uniref:hypothetical protein n=1 Tax=Microbacterium hominis TaxID=162426 RepID=UPI001965BBC9|nr:hypothetical protein [Microbacterium hominis]QRY40929.1 hypothetical protein JVX92_01160 [Microbacterium hominis]
MSLNIQITSGGIAAPASVLSPVALDERGMLAEAGFDPDTHIIDGAVATSVNARGFTYRFKAVRVVHDLPALHAAVKGRRSAPYKTKAVSGLGAVVVYSDPQWGKTASGGGTAETIERSARIRGDIVQSLRRKAPEEIGFVDLATASRASCLARPRIRGVAARRGSRARSPRAELSVRCAW